MLTCYGTPEDLGEAFAWKAILSFLVFCYEDDDAASAEKVTPEMRLPSRGTNLSHDKRVAGVDATPWQPEGQRLQRMSRVATRPGKALSYPRIALRTRKLRHRFR
jgi:hypothetical protein